MTLAVLLLVAVSFAPLLWLWASSAPAGIGAQPPRAETHAHTHSTQNDDAWYRTPGAYPRVGPGPARDQLPTLLWQPVDDSPMPAASELIRPVRAQQDSQPSQPTDAPLGWPLRSPRC